MRLCALKLQPVEILFYRYYRLAYQRIINNTSYHPKRIAIWNEVILTAKLRINSALYHSKSKVRAYLGQSATYHLPVGVR